MSSNKVTKLVPYALLLAIVAVVWFLLRPDTVPSQITGKPVIESVDEALEIFADPRLDSGLDEQTGVGVITSIADERKQSPDIELDELPTLDSSDREFLESLQGIAPAPEWLSWLPADELVRKLVVVVDKAAQGDIERSFLSLPRLEGAVGVVASGERFEIVENNYRRYVAYVSIVDKFDAELLVAIYKQFEPLFESAYGELGYANRNFRSALDRALMYASISPPPVREPKLEKIGDRYQYVDKSVEGLPAIQKLYLRMGPENTLVLQNKMSEIQQALQ
ncbi:MAG: DUF3014 domain-containing protein [Proteobacteria bacterium]|nr:DUF3014 domain-containing protein [Pseudomonadota bacterium]